MTEMDLTRCRELLIRANSISSTNRRTRNYFEVAGYPNYENVASSILAFFFDTNEEHGMKDLWLRSLMECYFVKSGYADTDRLIEVYETSEDGVVREDVTNDNKRIDIVIPTNNDIVIAIENKIYAGVNNPFKTYGEWINEQYKQWSNRIEIVLSLYPVGDNSDLDGIDSYGNPYSFVNITYMDFFSEIKDNIGSYLTGINEKWLIYMNEFMKNIESMKETNMNINKDWQMFLEENKKLIGEFNQYIQNDRAAKLDLVKKLSVALQDRINNNPTPVTTKAYTYGSLSTAPHISLVIDITKDESTTIVLEPFFFKPGLGIKDDQHMGVFYVSIWVREKGNRERELAWLEELLSRQRIAYVTRVSSSWGNYLEIKQFDYKKSVDNQVVEDYIFDLWKTIAGGMI